jgi:hypothetical protein
VGFFFYFYLLANGIHSMRAQYLATFEAIAEEDKPLRLELYYVFLKCSILLSFTKSGIQDIDSLKPGLYMQNYGILTRYEST